MLDHVVGPERVRAEPRAAAKIARLCDGLPLALRIAADRAGMVPAASLASLAGPPPSANGSTCKLRQVTTPPRSGLRSRCPTARSGRTRRGSSGCCRRIRATR